MLLLLSFYILKYASSKVNSKKLIRQIEGDFENFKLAATKDELILNAVDSFNLDKTMTTTADIFNELLHAANIIISYTSSNFALRMELRASTGLTEAHSECAQR